MKHSRRTILLALSIALTVTLSVAIITTLAGFYGTGELIYNGGFEHGFTAQNGCGMVGEGWGCFTTGGRGGYGFYDDGWDRVVASGKHAQMFEINTKNDFGDSDRTAGIYQQVPVIPGETYTLSLQGMIRADDLDSGGDPWRYVMLVGFSHDGGTNWAHANVQEIDVGPIQDRVDPSGYYPAHVQVTAQSHTLTVFIAGRMKWGDWNREVDFDVDDVSLIGPVYTDKVWPKPPVVDKSVVKKHRPKPKPVPMPVPLPEPEDKVIGVSHKLVCDGPNLLWNGNFEEGFAANGVGAYWWPYNNNGAANYGYYDDAWPPVVAEGKHAQLLEINTKGIEATHPNRWVGIYQEVWLRPGKIYELSLKAMMREEADHSDEDPNRYEVYWGLNAHHPIAEVTGLDALEGVPVSEISLRESPGSYSSYSTTFKAHSEQTWLYLLGLKKWATVEREIDFDLDDVQLRACRKVTVVQPIPVPFMEKPYEPEWPAMPDPHQESFDEIMESHESNGEGVCTYLVKSGDTLANIAQMYGTTEAMLVEMNNLVDASIIFVMQPLWVPCNDTMPDHFDSHSDNNGADAVEASGGDSGGDAKASRKGVEDSGSSRERDGEGASARKRDSADEGSNRTRNDDEVDSSRKRGSEDTSRSRGNDDTTEQEQPAEAQEARVHVVEAGEYLGQIALRYGVTVKALTIENHIENPSVIQPGQEVLIPKD